MDSHTQLTPPQVDWSTMGFDFGIMDSMFGDSSILNSNYEPMAASHFPTTPPKSPIICSSGTRLIPKVRAQDLVSEPAIVHYRHQSQGSLSSSGFPMDAGPPSRRPSISRRSSSPATAQLLTPMSNRSSPMTLQMGRSLPVYRTKDAASVQMSLAVATPTRPTIPHSRSISTSALPTHKRSRNLSNASLDGDVLKYGYPTYRNMPQTTATNRPRTASALSQCHLTPMLMLDAPMSSVANIPPQLPAPSPSNASSQSDVVFDSNDYAIAADSSFPTELSVLNSFASSDSPFFSDTGNPIANQFSSLVDPAPVVELPSLASDVVQPSSTLHAYLTSPSPSPSLVRRIHEPPRTANPHHWFDIRNLRRWTTFTHSTLLSMPGVAPLLNSLVPQTSLPIPRRTISDPETQAQLHKILSDFFAVKVNAALRIALGTDSPPLELRSFHSPTTTTHPAHPEFLANYTTDTEVLLPSSTSIAAGTKHPQRGRAVGIVLPYEKWNSGMRAQSASTQVKYLNGLAQLHASLRAHGCRYGFIITEIELVCVRYGGDNGAAEPLFGFLEIAEPVRLSTTSSSSSPSSSGQEGGELTAAMALFFLLLLASKLSLPDQWTWRLEVGGPAALTRKKHLGRDPWIPQPNLAEKREAKRARGWVWPDEEMSRKERGRGRRKIS